MNQEITDSEVEMQVVASDCELVHELETYEEVSTFILKVQ